MRKVVSWNAGGAPSVVFGVRPLMLWKTECDMKLPGSLCLYASEHRFTGDCHVGMVEVILEVVMLKFWGQKDRDSHCKAPKLSLNPPPRRQEATQQIRNTVAALIGCASRLLFFDWVLLFSDPKWYIWKQESRLAGLCFLPDQVKC